MLLQLKVMMQIIFSIKLNIIDSQLSLSFFLNVTNLDIKKKKFDEIIWFKFFFYISK